MQKEQKTRSFPSQLGEETGRQEVAETSRARQACPRPQWSSGFPRDGAGDRRQPPLLSGIQDGKRNSKVSQHARQGAHPFDRRDVLWNKCVQRGDSLESGAKSKEGDIPQSPLCDCPPLVGHQNVVRKPTGTHGDFKSGNRNDQPEQRGPVSPLLPAHEIWRRKHLKKSTPERVRPKSEPFPASDWKNDDDIWHTVRQKTQRKTQVEQRERGTPSFGKADGTFCWNRESNSQFSPAIPPWPAGAGDRRNYVGKDQNVQTIKPSALNPELLQTNVQSCEITDKKAECRSKDSRDTRSEEETKGFAKDNFALHLPKNSPLLQPAAAGNDGPPFWDLEQGSNRSKELDQPFLSLRRVDRPLPGGEEMPIPSLTCSADSAVSATGETHFAKDRQEYSNACSTCSTTHGGNMCDLTPEPETDKMSHETLKPQEVFRSLRAPASGHGRSSGFSGAQAHVSTLPVYEKIPYAELFSAFHPPQASHTPPREDRFQQVFPPAGMAIREMWNSGFLHQAKNERGAVHNTAEHSLLSNSHAQRRQLSETSHEMRPFDKGCNPGSIGMQDFGSPVPVFSNLSTVHSDSAAASVVNYLLNDKEGEERGNTPIGVHEGAMNFATCGAFLHENISQTTAEQDTEVPKSRGLGTEGPRNGDVRLNVEGPTDAAFSLFCQNLQPLARMPHARLDCSESGVCFTKEDLAERGIYFPFPPCHSNSDDRPMDLGRQNQRNFRAVVALAKEIASAPYGRRYMTLFYLFMHHRGMKVQHQHPVESTEKQEERMYTMAGVNAAAAASAPYTERCKILVDALENQDSATTPQDLLSYPEIKFGNPIQNSNSCVYRLDPRPNEHMHVPNGVSGFSFDYPAENIFPKCAPNSFAPPQESCIFYSEGAPFPQRPCPPQPAPHPMASFPFDPPLQMPRPLLPYQGAPSGESGFSLHLTQTDDRFTVAKTFPHAARTPPPFAPPVNRMYTAEVQHNSFAVPATL
ncbi:UNVERIFIED_CONTAM: hypothetical protein HHA_226880 [Hammondia hammondi]|eukprot:XP_008882060.1 hypothetical protein HHA_226880 [Hammondia hammondi]